MKISDFVESIVVSVVDEMGQDGEWKELSGVGVTRELQIDTEFVCEVEGGIGSEIGSVLLGAPIGGYVKYVGRCVIE